MWSGDAFVPFYLDQLNAHMGSERAQTLLPAGSMILQR
jgi:hypothetical protein